MIVVRCIGCCAFEGSCAYDTTCRSVVHSLVMPFATLLSLPEMASIVLPVKAEETRVCTRRRCSRRMEFARSKEEEDPFQTFPSSQGLLLAGRGWLDASYMSRNWCHT